LNDQTFAFEYIYDIFTIRVADLRKHAKTFAELYNVDSNDFIVEFLLFRGRFNTKTFGHFSNFAKFVLSSLSTDDFPLLQFFVAIILILPFATVNCERSFSAMNRIKSLERNKLRDILMDLLLLYDITPEEKAKLNINKLAYDIIHNVWKYEKDFLDPKLQQNVHQMYSMMFF